VLSPEIFSSDDEGFCLQRGTEITIPSRLEDRGRLAVESCPEGAIKVVIDTELANPPG
jgi:ferredoxin